MNDDIITLGGVQWPIIGQIVVGAASEFESGIKIGKVNYDNRENAFFLVANDYTGGFGSRIMDVREELGTYWFAGQNSPETSYANRVTLPLKQEYFAISDPPLTFDGNVSIGYQVIERPFGYCFGLGSGLYVFTTLGSDPSKLHDPGGVDFEGATPHQIVSVISAVDSTEGEQRIYVVRYSPNAVITEFDPENNRIPSPGTIDYTVWVQINNFPWVSVRSITPEFNRYAPIQGVLGQLVSQDIVYIYQVGTTVNPVSLTSSSTETVDADGTANDTTATASGTTQQLVTYPELNYKIFPAMLPYPNRVEDGGQFDEHAVVVNADTTQIDHLSVLEAIAALPSTDERGLAISGSNITYTFPWLGSVPLVGHVVPIDDLFFWDHKVLGIYDGNKLVFLTPASGDGLNIYSLPPGTYITGLNYTQIGAVTVGTTVSTQAVTSSSAGAVDGEGTANDASTTATTSQEQAVLAPELHDLRGWVVDHTYSVGPDYNIALNHGEEPWNNMVEGDEQVLAAVEIDRELRFVGVAVAPWGEPAVYLRGGSHLYVLDFFSRKIFPIEIGSNRPIVQARMSNGVIVWTDGWEIGEFNPQSNTNRNLGLPAKWGIAPNLVGYQVIDLEPYDKELIAVLVEPSEPATVLYKYNGIGWAQMGAVMHGFFAQHGFRATLPPPGTIFTGRQQAFILPGTDAVSSPTQFGYWQFTLPMIAHQPTVGVDTFGASGARFYSGWLDGGFSDINGTLLRMNIDAFFPSANEKVRVEYRLNNDPVTEESATWTPLVDITGVPQDFSSSNRILYFNNTVTSPKAGIAYRTVQFRITLLRGSDATLSPELRALTLTHLKTPPLRTQWTFNIDVDRMTQNNTGAVETFYIDGNVATVERVWGKLRDLWINNNILIPMTAPSVLSDDEVLYVKLTAMPLNVDDIRSSVDGRGVVQIQLVEPVD